MTRRSGAALLIHALALALALTTIALVGQPIYANDTWIHLALGEQFALQGPFLASDPHLYAAAGPPPTSSWLGSVAIWQVQSLLGFSGLRAFHAILVALIFALAWIVMRRVAGSAQAASAGLVGFILLSTYRIVQLRPDLFTMVATLAVVLLLIAPRAGPSPGRVAVAVLLSALWANLHAAFLLGPILVLGVSASLLALPLIPGVAVEAEDRARAGRLALAGALMLLASLVNPAGWDAHLAYLVAGDETLALSAVADEWGPTNLFALPQPRLPPTWAAWVACWLCVLAIGAGAWRLLSELRGRIDPAERQVDPAVLALAVAGVTAAILASRFLWLGVFALAVGLSLVFDRSARDGGPRVWSPSIPVFVGLLAASWLHFQAGDWVLVSRSFRAVGSDYRAPYYARKFNGHAVWFLADSGVEGRIYNDYPLGGFMSFWLSPAIRMSSSGTMNVAREAMDANLAIASRRTLSEGEDFASLLDRQGIDLFLGTGLPIEVIPGRRNPSTVHHLEGEPGWIPVFRSLRSVVYLRRNARNEQNLTRVARYYADEGVPFDRESGFDPEAAISRATQWSIAHGLIPENFPALLEAVRGAAARGRPSAGMRRAATLYATLGLYDRALAIDDWILQLAPGNVESARRRIWCLLRQGRDQEALETAAALESVAGAAAASAGWSETIRGVIEADPADRLRLLSLIPLYRSAQAGAVQRGMIAPPARTERARPRP